LKTVFHKVKKIILWVIGVAVVFVILVVVLVDRDENTGKITIPFLNKESKVSDDGFNRLVEQELNLTKLAEVDWAGAYNKALEEQYGIQDKNSTSSQKTLIANNEKENEKIKKDEVSKIFIQYLIKSEIQLDENKNPLTLAIQYRDEGKTDKIDELIADLDKKTKYVEAITPPTEALGYHLVKLRLLRETEGILEMIKESKKEEKLEDVISENEFEHLANLSLILKKYLTYFFLTTNKNQ